MRKLLATLALACIGVTIFAQTPAHTQHFPNAKTGTVLYGAMGVSIPPSKWAAANQWLGSRFDMIIGGGDTGDARGSDLTKAYWGAYTDFAHIYNSTDGDMYRMQMVALANGFDFESMAVHTTVNLLYNLLTTYNGVSRFDAFEEVYGGNWVGGIFTSVSGTFADITNASAGTISDTLYVGYQVPFDQINVTISTARVGGTVAYQYWNGSTWATLTTTDGTSGLTTTGQIAFTPPSAWERYGLTVNVSSPKPIVTTNEKFWVRIVVSGASTAPIFDSMFTDDWTLATTDVTGTTPVTVDSMLYVGKNTPFTQMDFTIGTPRGAGGVTYYEYWDGDSWNYLGVADSLTDTTNGLLNTGSVTFTSPATWKMMPIPVGTTQTWKYWIRLATYFTTDKPVYTNTSLGTGLNVAATNINLRGWDAGSGTIINGATEFPYNPTPPSGALAKFRYQARVTNQGLNFVYGNPSYSPGGVNAWGKFMAEIINDKITVGNPYDAAFFDDFAQLAGGLALSPANSYQYYDYDQMIPWVDQITTAAVAAEADLKADHGTNFWVGGNGWLPQEPPGVPLSSLNYSLEEAYWAAPTTIAPNPTYGGVSTLAVALPLSAGPNITSLTVASAAGMTDTMLFYIGSERIDCADLVGDTFNTCVRNAAPAHSVGETVYGVGSTPYSLFLPGPTNPDNSIGYFQCTDQWAQTVQWWNNPGLGFTYWHYKDSGGRTPMECLAQDLLGRNDNTGMMYQGASGSYLGYTQVNQVYLYGADTTITNSVSVETSGTVSQNIGLTSAAACVDGNLLKIGGRNTGGDIALGVIGRVSQQGLDITAQLRSGNSPRLFTGSPTTLLFGDVSPFSSLLFEIASPTTSTLGVVYEYWNGSTWTTLSVTDGTADLTQNGNITWTPPMDWATTTDGFVSGMYYMRITTFAHMDVSKWYSEDWKTFRTTSQIFNAYTSGDQANCVNTHYWEDGETFSTADVYAWGRWFPAMSVNIGTETVARQIPWKTGGAPDNISGQASCPTSASCANVWRRDFTNGIVLFRPYSAAMIESELETYSVPIALGGNYYSLASDGTLGSAINSIQLRGGEGAVLLNSAEPPATIPRINGNIRRFGRRGQ